MAPSRHDPNRCERCGNISPSTKLRVSDEKLCDDCFSGIVQAALNNAPSPRTNKTQSALANIEELQNMKQLCETCGTSQENVTERRTGLRECIECYIKQNDVPRPTIQNQTHSESYITNTRREKSKDQITNCQLCNIAPEYWIQCELCDIWLCLECANVQKHQYKAIDNAKKRNLGLRFFCQRCNTKMNTILMLNKTNTNENVPMSPKEATTNITESNQPDEDWGTSCDIDAMNDQIMNVAIDPPTINTSLTCDKTPQEQNREINNINTKLSAIEGRFRKLEDCMERLLNVTSTKQEQAAMQIQKNNEIVQSYATIVSQNIEQHSRRQEPQSETTESTIIHSLAEYNERKRRENNLIIYGLPETGYLPAQMQQISKELNVTNTEVTKHMRLGQQNPNRPRPVLIVIKDKLKKIQLLTRGKLLRSKTNYLKDIYIAPDMTPTEREENRRIVNELRNRRNTGEENLIIRQGKIVSKPTPSAPVSFRI